jgi:hypothetical protein
VPERLKGVPPDKVRDPAWLPEAIEKVEVFTAFSFDVATDPPTETFPEARLKTPFALRFVLEPT